MISQRCRHQGRGSVFNRCFTSSIDTCAAAWVTLAIPFLLLLCQDLLLILPQIADWYQTLFPIASCTKAFTTASLAILADQGKLNWDTPVREYIPSFKLYDPFASERVTPRDLVSHRTGLPRHGLVWYHNTTATRRELFERLQHLEPTKDLRSF